MENDSDYLTPGEIPIGNWNWSVEYDPPFHKPSYSSSLIKYYNLLFASDVKCKVFVPLCGKSLDMIYLADKGHEIVGLEFSEIGIECFFKENKLTYEKSDVVNYSLYKANEKDISIYRGDMFDLNVDICGYFDVIWDRGGYVAINVPDQKKYANLVSSLLKPNGKLLLEATTYDMTKYSGPPHYIDKENLEKNFGEKYRFELLESFTNEHPAYFPEDLELKKSIFMIFPK